MENRWILIALFIPLIIAISLFRPSETKELRPSNHGLPNQAAESPETAQAKSPEMSSFFGDGGTQSLPEARNISEPSWDGRRDGGGEHVRKAFIVSGLVCGIAGVVLLSVAGFLFVRRHRNKGASPVVVSS